MTTIYVVLRSCTYANGTETNVVAAFETEAGANEYVTQVADTDTDPAADYRWEAVEVQP